VLFVNPFVKVSALLKQIAASKQALQQQLEQQKKEQQQSALLKKAVKQQKLHQQQQQTAPVGPPGSGLTPPKPGSSSEEKQKYMQALQADIQARLKALPSTSTSLTRSTSTNSIAAANAVAASLSSKSSFPPPLILDPRGRVLDALGNPVTKLTRDSVTTLKANQRYKVNAKLADLNIPGTSAHVSFMQVINAWTTDAPSKKAYFDPNLAAPTVKDRRKR
jgi:hypothetical protein